MFLRPTLVLSLSALSLAACKTTTTPDPKPEVKGVTYKTELPADQAAARVFASDRGDVGKVMSAGATLTARASLGVSQLRDRETGKVSNLDSSPKFAMKKNDAGAVDVTYGDESFSFVKADGSAHSDGKVYGYSQQKQGVGYFRTGSYVGSVEDWMTEGKGWHTVVSTTRDNGKHTRSFYVVGTETKDSELSSQQGEVTYVGGARMNAAPATGYQDYEKSNIRIKGDVQLTADFTKGTIGGEMTKIQSRSPGESDYSDEARKVTFGTTSFTGNGYSGKVTSTNTATNEVETATSGTYSGAFFGPKADSTAGVMSVEFQSNKGTDLKGYGFFSTNRK